MRDRQGPLTAAVCALCALATGCGVTFHSSDTVTLRSKPAEHVTVLRNGGSVPHPSEGVHTVPVFLNDAGGIVALAPGKRIKRVDVPLHVNGWAIAGDVAWSLTIVGIAAPISDAILAGFQKVEPEIQVELEDDPPDDSENPMPVYSVEGEAIKATLDPPPPPPAPAVEAAPEPPPPPPPPTPKKRSRARPRPK